MSKQINPILPETSCITGGGWSFGVFKGRPIISFRRLLLFTYTFFPRSMTHQARVDTVVESLTRAPRTIAFPERNGRIQSVSEIFGENVFSLPKMSKMLPKPVFQVLQ